MKFKIKKYVTRSFYSKMPISIPSKSLLGLHLTPRLTSLDSHFILISTYVFRIIRQNPFTANRGYIHSSFITTIKPFTHSKTNIGAVILRCVVMTLMGSFHLIPVIRRSSLLVRKFSNGFLQCWWFGISL
jgi:hypothetical protein